LILCGFSFQISSFPQHVFDHLRPAFSGPFVYEGHARVNSGRKPWTKEAGDRDRVLVAPSGKQWRHERCFGLVADQQITGSWKLADRLFTNANRYHL
jgi:hypothetical protein